MAELNTRIGPRQHLSILRSHVLAPLSTAEDIATNERDEVAVECEAFADLADRIDRIDPVSVPTPTIPRRIDPDETNGSRTDELRDAYRATVMAVPHYDEVYGEHLVANVAAELGPAFAALFRPGSGISFTAQHKTLLTGAVDQLRTDREEYCDLLEAELDSLRSTRWDLSGLLDTLDNSVVPDWYRPKFESRVDEIHFARQTTLYGRSLPASYDGHTLCAYLYDDQPWTYPGLTSVARLLGSVVLRES